MKKLLCLILLSTPLLAFAPPGHDGHGLAAGFLHPLSGWDHCLAMLAVGVWAAMVRGKQQFTVLASFVGGMALGGWAGMQMLFPTGVETMIQATTLLAALLVVLAVRLPALLQSAVAVSFAVLHGMAHGMELPGQADAWQYGFGFLLAAALLLLAGWGMGRWLKSERCQRGLGLLLAVAAGGFIVA